MSTQTQERVLKLAWLSSWGTSRLAALLADSEPFEGFTKTIVSLHIMKRVDEWNIYWQVVNEE